MASPAYAACTSPTGQAGDIAWASNYSVPVYCDGTNWNSMAGGSGGGSADNLGNHTATQALNMGGFDISNLATATGTAAVLGGLTVTGNASITTISATNISGSLIQVGTGNSATCSSAIKGAIRYSNTSSTLEYCNSTAWTSLGPSDTLPVSFHVHKNSGTQAMTGALGKITWSTESFDSNNNFDNVTNNRFQPTVPGRYLLIGSAKFASQGNLAIVLYKNGAAVAANQMNYVGGLQVQVSTIVDMNGSSDYVELFAANDNSANLAGTPTTTYFSGSLLGSQAGGGGGATPGGTDTQVQFNDGGSALGGDADYTWNKTSNVLNVTGLISGSNISSSGVVQVSGSSLTCSSATKGAIRYSNTSSTIEYCNSTAWTSMGPSATTVPSFSVHKNGTNQTVVAATLTKLTWSTEIFDTNNNFASDRFTPSIAGKYLVTVSVVCVDNTSYCLPLIYKNGIEIARAQYQSATQGGAQATMLVDMNGTTDYLEAYGWNSGGTSIVGINTYTYFTGTLIAPYGQGGGGGDSTAESDRITSGTLSVLANSATSVVSLSTAGTTWGYLGSNASYLPTITSNYISASGISVSGVVQVSGSILACSSATKGAMRYSNTSSTIEYCNSTAWTSFGPSTSAPAFSAYQTSNQTISHATNTKVTFDAEEFDTNNNFDLTNERYTVTVPGKYLFTASVLFQTGVDQTQYVCQLVKNGAIIKTDRNIESGTINVACSISALADASNGDYFELQVEQQSGSNKTTNGQYALTWFQGTLIGGGGGSGGGGSAPGGTDTQVQFNDGGSALGGDADYTWNKTTNTLTIAGDINYTGTLTDTSDRRLKSEIAALPANMLDKIMLMKPVTFRMKDGNRTELGFIAQDVESIFPDLVQTALDAGGTKSLNSIGLIAPTIKAVQELKADNDNLRMELKAANDNHANLKREVEEMKRAVGLR